VSNDQLPDGQTTVDAPSASSPRPRSLGLRLGHLPAGQLNAITDVDGVLVGHLTLRTAAAGSCVCTGVTAIVPRPRDLLRRKVGGAVHAINAYGKAAGVTQVNELGVIETPIVLTNTLSVGAAYTGIVMWALEEVKEVRHGRLSVNPLVFECNDGWLNDIGALTVQPSHVVEAIATASSVSAEGSVGAGTGMMCYGWKGGIGTASRVIAGDTEHRLGALVLANFGTAAELVIGGAPIGQLLRPVEAGPGPPDGSCIVVLATDAPLDPMQLRRLATRAQYGLGRTGTFGHHGSGDYAVAFSTAQIGAFDPLMDSPRLDLFFQAAVEAVEESIVNALFTAETVTGFENRAGYRLPVGQVLEIIQGYGDQRRRSS
jgi:D-aminopeptidase